jgi:predicted DNA binding CopG/RHH family protein
MAKKELKQEPLLDGIKEIQDAIFASNNGLSRDFVEKNDKRVQVSNAVVSNLLQGFGYGVLGANTNSITELANIVQQTITDTRHNKIVHNPADDDVSGVRMITPMGNIDMAEQEIIAMSSSVYQSFLNRTNEYRGVVELIPEVKRAIENIIRDIVNVSDITNKAFNNVYVDKFNRSISDEEKDADKRKNELIISEIVDKNNLEVKYKRWLYESAVSGVKPVAFLPYSYIFRQLKNSVNNKFGFKIEDYQNRIKNGESFSLFDNKEKKKIDEFYKANIEYSLIDCIKNSNRVKSNESAQGIEYQKLIEEILDDDSVDSYASFVESGITNSLESLAYRFETIRDTRNKRLFTGSESTEMDSIDKEMDLISMLQKTYKDKQEKLQELGAEDRIKLARQGLKTFVEYIDDHIKVPKHDSSTAVLAEKILREKNRYDALYDLGKDYKIAEGVMKAGYRDPNIIKNDTIGAFDAKSSLGKECLIVPYAAESVIPINVNGEYLGFYCLEYEHVLGNSWKNRRRAGSFTDYVKQQGIGDDSMFLGSNYNFNAYGGALDPLENNIYSPISLYNYNTSNYFNGGLGGNSDDRRFDTMKTIITRVLAHRLHDPDLIDNKIFKDAVMHLLRNDLLLKNKVQFTFIPPEFMCYITWKTDDDGVPVSILDGTLYDAYLYISSKTASGMIKLLKSSDKEKYEVDVGLTKNLGYSIDEMQRVLSTRNVFSQSYFSNLSTVLKTAGNYQRLIIPVVKGNKLYDVTQIERMNDLTPDDDFTNQRLQSILSKIYYNNGTFSELDNNIDFAKQLFTRNLEYSSCIKEGQFNYNSYGTKILRILTSYSNLPTYNSIVDDIKQQTGKNKLPNQQNIVSQPDTLINSVKDDIDHENGIDIACIELQLNMPSYLQMLTVTDTIDTAKAMANALAEAHGAPGGNQIDEATLDIFKLKLIKKFTTNIDWITVDNFMEQAQAEAKAKAALRVKTNTIDEHIQNPQNSQTDIASEVAEDTGNGEIEDNDMHANDDMSDTNGGF